MRPTRTHLSRTRSVLIACAVGLAACEGTPDADLSDASARLDAETDAAPESDAEAGGETACGSTCEDRLDCWDAENARSNQSEDEVFVHSKRLSVQAASTESNDAPAPWATYAIDGASATSWKSATRPGETEELIIRLDDLRRIRAVDIDTLGAYDVEIYVAPTLDCWGQPMASGAVSPAATTTTHRLRLAGEGRMGQFVRLVFRSSAGGVEINEVRVRTTAGVWNDLPKYAVASLHYQHTLEADLPSAPPERAQSEDAPHFALISGPEGATLTADGVLDWVPTSTAAGQHTLEVSASAGDDVVRRSLEIQVLRPTVIGSALIDTATGGEVAVTDPASPFFGLSVTIPPEAGDHVEIWSFVDMTLEGFATDFTPWANSLMIVGPTRPVTLEASPALLETIRGPAAWQDGGSGNQQEMPRPSVAVGAYDLPGEHANNALRAAAAAAAGAGAGTGTGTGTGTSERLAIVGGECDGSVGDNGPERQRTLLQSMHTNVLIQLLEHQGTCYRIEQQPFSVYYWDNAGLDSTTVESRMNFVLAAAERTRGAMSTEGCVPLSEPVDILMAPLSDSGIAPPEGRQILVERSLPDDHLANVVYHELTHTIHQRTVRWVNAETYDYDKTVDRKWAVEGLAVFNEDEIDNKNIWANNYLDVARGVPLLNRNTVTLGLRGNARYHAYLQFAFFKALKARTGFNVCSYLAQRSLTASAYDALDAMLGGTEARNLEYARFVATWLLPVLVDKTGRIDDDDILPDQMPEMRDRVIIPDYGLPGCGNKSRSRDIEIGGVAGGDGFRLVCKTPPPAPRAYRIKLTDPEDHATMLVFDDQGEEIFHVPPGEEVLLPSDSAEFSVAVALDQGREEDGLGQSRAIKVKVDSGQTTIAFRPVSETESPTDSQHPALLNGPWREPNLRYFSAATAPSGWPDNALYETLFPSGIKAGNIDWVSREGDIITWNGPHGRSVPARSEHVDNTPINMPANYVPVWSNRRAHRGSAVYANGSVLFDFGATNYVAGAAIRSAFDIPTLTQKRYLLAFTTNYVDKFDRIWSVDLETDPKIAVEIGQVVLPDARVFDFRRRIHGYYCNASATRCSSVLPVESAYTADITTVDSVWGTKAEQVYATFGSQIVGHVDFPTATSASVSFEPEILGEVDQQKHFDFQKIGSGSTSGSPLQVETTETMRLNVSNIPLAIDYVGDTEVRMTASIKKDVDGHHIDYQDYGPHGGPGYANQDWTSESTLEYHAPGLSLTETEVMSSSYDFPVFGGDITYEDGTVASRQKFLFADLRHGVYAYMTTKETIESTTTARFITQTWISGPLHEEFERKLYVQGQVVASGLVSRDGQKSRRLDIIDIALHSPYFDNIYTSQVTDTTTEGAMATVTLNTGLEYNVFDGQYFLFIPEAAIVGRGEGFFSLEYPDLSSYDFEKAEFSADYSSFNDLATSSTLEALTGVHGSNLRMTEVSLF
ncbi:MAG: hypothetical protein H6729_01275 [Deltaproteobacteria bacterium]|nr:hypothetical protein [Deltaproteobacteria bacterium]